MPTAPKNRRAFTLFELLIVVLLIAILYGVFINKLQQRSPAEASKSVTLETLKKALSLFPAARERELICTEPCKTCTVYIDGSAVKASKIPLFKAAPTVWKPDRFGQLQQQEFLPLNDPEHGVKEVCFRYKLFRNGSSSSYIVQTDEKHFYIFKPYMQPVKAVTSLSDAQEAFGDTALIPTERRNYNF